MEERSDAYANANARVSLEGMWPCLLVWVVFMCCQEKEAKGRREIIVYFFIGALTQMAHLLL